MVLIIDNYDSFTYNIYQRVGNLGYSVIVEKNNKIRISDIESMSPSHIIVSPGPMGPENTGISQDVIQAFSKKIPILGVCLGMQTIYHYYGGDIVQSNKIMHGKLSLIKHTGGVMFSGIPEKFFAMRYHSLAVDLNSRPKELDVVAHSDSGEVMAVEAKKDLIYGVQFHPEAFLTEFGDKIIHNFCRL